MTKIPSPALLYLLVVTILPLIGCQPADGPNLAPIGNGIAFLGICVVVAMLVLVIGGRRQP